MGRTVIRFSLTPESIDAAIAQIRQYKNDFEQKCVLFREKVAERIWWNADHGFRIAPVGMIVSGPKPVNDVQVHVGHGYNMSIVWATGKEAVFIEYGAGVYYNGNVGSSPHPWGPRHGYLIGKYGQGHGARRAWGYYDANGNRVVTRGTPADMPLYFSIEEAIRALNEIAEEVFG